MPVILPVQLLFDKDIPEEFGNLEYRQERQLLIDIDQIILDSGIEYVFIQHFLDRAYAQKAIELFGTGKQPYLNHIDRLNIHADAVMALRMSILRKRLNLSLRKFSLALSHSDLYKWFCGINRFSVPRIPGKSHINELENAISPHLVSQVERMLFAEVQNGPVMLEPLDFSQAYFDCTCIEANIHYPIDWLLLRDSTRTLMKAVKRIRRAGIFCRMPFEPAEFITEMNKLCMEMTFANRRKDAKKLRKAVLRRMKQLTRRVLKHSVNHLRKLESDWKTADITYSNVQRIIKQITSVTEQLADVVKQAHERIIGERKVANADKILSIYEPDVNVVIRRKAGAETEFGNKLYLAEQADGLIVDWELYRDQTPADKTMLQTGHKRLEDKLGCNVKLMAGDRGFDSAKNREYMESHDIFNAVCPCNPTLLAERLEDKTFRQAQTRRSQTEARISILGNCFCGSPVRQKGFENRKIHMGLSILSHNLWVLARIRHAQEVEREKENEKVA